VKRWSSAKCDKDDKDDKDDTKLDLPENLNSYIIVYRIISNSGPVDVSNKKIKIDSKSQQNAIEILRNKLEIDNGSAIRIDRIERVNIEKEPEKKRKRSLFGWVAGGIIVLAGLANLLSKLL